MGVHPEPARCADDAGRPMPDGWPNMSTARPAHGRGPGYRRTARDGAGPGRRPLRALAIGLAVALLPGLAAPAGASTGRAGPDAVGSDLRSDMRRNLAASEWGTETSDPGSALRLPTEGAGAALTETETLRFGATAVPRGLVETIGRAAAETGADPAYMMALADKESSFDTDVKAAASSAQGLFQFVTGTWLEMIRDYGARHGLAEEAAAVTGRGGAVTVPDAAMRRRVLDLRNDPYVSGLMAGEAIRRDRERIEARLGRALKTTELYLAHFLGTASAGRFLSLSAENPEAPAQRAFGRAARANRGIFTRKDGPRRRSLTVAEVHERLDGMIDQRLARYAGVAALVTGPVLDARLRLGPEVVPQVGAPITR